MSSGPGRFSEIGLGSSAHFGPISAHTATRFVDLLELGESSMVLDIGCGKGTFILEIARRYGCNGLGIDLSHRFIEMASQQAEDVPKVSFVAGDASELVVEPGSVDLAICIGSTHAFGAFEDTLRALKPLLRPGGMALIGDGYWKRTPDPEYLARLGATADDYTTHEGNIQRARTHGFELIADHASTDAEWEEFESSYAASIHRFVDTHPDDPESPAMLERITKWEETVARWGKHTLGFGLYLLRLS